ncbi:MAG: hypothetical protein K2P98_03470 [Neisseriaceae bacterium]|nr:hypothetical protein [Neisseriaceae bacterium]
MLTQFKFIFLAFLASACNLLWATQPPEAIINEQQATEVINQFIKNIKDQNVAALEKSLDSDYRHIHGTGLVENKETFINAIKNKTRIYNLAEMADLKITNLNAVAYGTAKLKINVTNPKGTLEASNLFTIIMHTNPNNKDQALTISQFQATKVD